MCSLSNIIPQNLEKIQPAKTASSEYFKQMGFPTPFSRQAKTTYASGMGLSPPPPNNTNETMQHALSPSCDP